MYWLYSIDTLIRIAIAMAVLFVILPALAWRRPATFTRLEWFWWNLGVGMTALTLVGQLLTLFNIATTAAYLAVFAAIIVTCRAYRDGVSPSRWIRNTCHGAVVFSLHVLDGRGEVRAGVRTRVLAALAQVRVALTQHAAEFWSWTTVVIFAAVTRLHRPFATGNLGFSDTYVHLYLMRLLDEGKQVDPAWGPYPRGMHFLLLAIDRLTNADPILLINFFGAVSGILLVLSAAYAAQRITGSTTSALVAGVLFATMIGGAGQYFVLGGSASSTSAERAQEFLSRPYDQLVTDAGEFDVLLTAFQRQAGTLPQELASVLLLPGVLFLLEWLRTRDRWRLAGFIGCTAAIAATHSGVVLPLVALCAAAALAVLLARTSTIGAISRGALWGAAGVALGSTWMLAFLRYRSVADVETAGMQSRVGATALYYFPFLRDLSGAGPAEDVAYMTLTPFLTGLAVVAAAITVVSAWRREAAAAWIPLATGLFILSHAATNLGLPSIIEARRNATWLAVAIAVLVAVALFLATRGLPRRVAVAGSTMILVPWLFTMPDLFEEPMRSRLLDYSGYSIATESVVQISRTYEPFTWTLVTYGQEYPMVLGRGFHINAADFITQYDPAEPALRIPTRHVFIAVEKKPHRFQVNSWSARFDRGAIQERMQTWCTLYAMTHRNMRVFLENDDMRVYRIDHVPQIAGGTR